jgi:hypothetical protein
MRDPIRKPIKRVEDAKGTFHESPQTRSHFERITDVFKDKY